jgi:hypothetical protein
MVFILPKIFDVVKKFIYILFFLAVNCQLAQAQLNFKIGYNASYFKADKFNTIFADYNNKNKLAYTNFRPIYFMNGVEMGLRYRSEFVALEAQWITNFADRSQSQWTDANQTAKQNQRIGISNQSFGGGLSFQFGKIGVGASLDRSYVNFNKKFIGQPKKTNIYDRALQYSSLSLFINFEGEMSKFLHFVARPYIQIPLNAEVGTLSLYKKILPTGDLTFADGDAQNMTLMGVKFIFFNGRQEQ